MRSAIEHYDLIVIGSGFASSFFLKKYLEKRKGKQRVLVLEKGPQKFHNERVREKRNGTYNNATLWQAKDHYETNNKEKDWKFTVSFGGSSNCWTGCTPRFMPNDFRMKSAYGVGEDWPFSYQDLEPYYDEAEKLMMISGPEETPFPRSGTYPLPAHKLSSFDKEVAKKYPGLWVSQPAARPSEALPGRAACCSTAVCDLCPVNSKFTIENGFGALYENPDISVSYNSEVLEMELGTDTVRKVKYKVDNSHFESTADLVALGANALFNSFLLLKSGDTNKLTGRGITEQAGAFARLYFSSLSNIGGTSIITTNGYMLYDTPSRKHTAGCIIESFNDRFIRNEPGKWRNIAKLKFIFEDLPDDNNYVRISADSQKPEIVFNRRSEYTLNALKQLPDQVERLFSFLPLDKISVDDYFQGTEYHICSTTRMSKDPDRGVLDENLIHHKYRNLLVLGSGAFPTITPSNPTLTLSALSLKAAENLLRT